MYKKNFKVETRNKKQQIKVYLSHITVFFVRVKNKKKIVEVLYN